ncbi:hypothetical protein B4O95_17695 [Acinetobacter baumannii]|nr:hypothetical protein B4O95_17695 [Acinetobacter baumannii]
MMSGWRHDQSQIEYTVTAKPVFSGCIKKNGRYVAYTQQGTILHDVAQSDCKKLIEQNDHNTVRTELRSQILFDYQV